MILLSGDIGGTKTILRLVEVASDRTSWKTIQETQYVSARYPHLVPMVQEFMQQCQLAKPTIASFAIAGPVIDERCVLTNLKWELVSEELERELNIPKVSLLNDFAANSYGVLGLQPDEIVTLQKGMRIPSAPIAVIGAGTGLGEGFLIANSDRYMVFPSEGGHTDFAPRDELEYGLFKYIQQKLNGGRVSVERVVSGQGILNIYQFLRDTKFAAENEEISASIKSWEKSSSTNIDPGAVISKGAHQQDPLCRKALEMFVSAYGAETGNLALNLLPYGGVYLAGGIAAKNLPFMKQDIFLESFQDKGRMGKLLDKIPVHIILNPQIGLLGSILYALDNAV